MTQRCLEPFHHRDSSRPGPAGSGFFISGVNPDVAYLRRGKTRKSAPDVTARRLGQVEAYFTVREVLSEASTAADGSLSRERSGLYRCRYATLGLSERESASCLTVEKRQNGGNNCS